MAKINLKKKKPKEDSLPNEMKKQRKKIGIAIHYILNFVKNSNDFPTTKSRARYFLFEMKKGEKTKTIKREIII